MGLAYRDDKLFKKVGRPANDFVFVPRQLGPLTLKRH